MVNAKTVVGKFKLAKGPRINWTPYTKDGERHNRVGIQGDGGEWFFDAVMKDGEHQWKIRITVPSGVQGVSAGTYEWPKGYRDEKLEDAKKELGMWINSLRSKGKIELHGWKKT